MKKRILYIILFLFTQASWAQPNFQKVFNLDTMAIPFAPDFVSIASGIFVTDSCYYMVSGAGPGPYGQHLNLSQISLDGELDTNYIHYTPEYDSPHHQFGSLDTNFRGNFVTTYQSQYNGEFKSPHILEYDATGTVILDTIYKSFHQDSLRFYDGATLIHSYEDSSYYVFCDAYYFGEITDDYSNFVKLFKINQYGDTLWSKKFSRPKHLKRRLSTRRLIFNIDSTELILSCLDKNSAPPPTTNNECLQRFYRLDLNGNTQEEWTFEEGQYIRPGIGVLPLENDGLIHSYMESRPNPNQPTYLQYRPVISKLDANHQQVWRDTLKTYWQGNIYFESNTPQSLIQVSDSVFAGASKWSYKWYYDNQHHPDSIPHGAHPDSTFVGNQIFNRSIATGKPLWSRYFAYWNPTETDWGTLPYYSIRDLKMTPDGGYIGCGEGYTMDSLGTVLETVTGEQGGPLQFAYIFKTNCLGFFGEPQSATTYHYNDNYEVFFKNRSIQAGSYTWFFGDGDTLHTTEYVDSVYHTYPGVGLYDVTLIAHGCNGIADTIIFEIDVPKKSLPTDGIVGDGTILTVYPNPVSSGESLSVYIGDLPNSKSYFEFVNTAGQIIFQQSLSMPQTAYLIQLPILESAVYFARIRSENEVVEVEKIIIE